MKIVLADGDAETIHLTRYALREYGYTVIAAADGMQALRRWEADEPDVVVVNARLPGTDGFDVCRTIRQRSNTPVIMISDRAADEDDVRGFEAGADDFIAKPFSHRQLAMRIRAVLNRTRGAVADKLIRQLQLSPGITLDLESRELRRGERLVRLTPLEFRIVFLLALSPGRVVSTSRLVDYAWTYESADPSMVKIHISRIRGKLKEIGCDPSALKSIRWVGYCLAIDASQARSLDGRLAAQTGQADNVSVMAAG